MTGKAIAPEKWEWFGHAGHFIHADRCVFHLHTHIGRWCISTVGEYFPNPDDEMQMVDSDHFYETMVFDTQAPDRWMEIDADAYNGPEDARLGHMRMCRKWACANQREGDKP